MKFSRSPFFALMAAALLAAPIAADTTSGGGVPNLSSAAKSESEAAASSTAPAKTDSAKTASNTGTGSNTDSAAATTKTGQSIQSTTIAITGGSSASVTGTIPTITGGSSASGSDTGLPKGLPSITGAFVIVAPSVPPTANAPYMHVSHMPEGTVFIAVGAILGFSAISVLLWRGLVAWTLHRSVKRAAAAQYNPDTKTLFRTPPAPFYKYSDHDSTISLGAIGAKNAKKGGLRSSSGPGAHSAGSLFFSPTKGAAVGSVGSAGNRGSNYLPAGYYASGAAQPGNGQGMTHIGQGFGTSKSLSNLGPQRDGHGQGLGSSISLSNLGPHRDGYGRGMGSSISLSNLGPHRDGYGQARSMGPSPPDSPGLRPQDLGYRSHNYGASSSTLALNGNYEEVRAPSAVLDDLFDGENALPVPGHGRRESSPRQF